MPRAVSLALGPTNLFLRGPFPSPQIAVGAAMCEPGYMPHSDREIRRIGRFIGLTELIGLLGVIGAVGMVVSEQPVAAGVFLLSAATAFGLGAVALLRR